MPREFIGLWPYLSVQTINRSCISTSFAVSSDFFRSPFRQVIRRMFSLSGFLSNTVTIGVRALVIDRMGHVFLIKHSYIPGWYLPGGGVEVGETLMTALARELLEEGNISLIEPPQLFGMYLNARTSRRDHVALYVVRSFHQGTPKPNRGIIAHGFFSPASLPGDTTPSTRARIGEVLEGRVVAEMW
jgi:8-oxo-dGTP pyrophosphatase MutT (NUDIX family)